jgi:hypothetical protein
MVIINYNFEMTANTGLDKSLQKLLCLVGVIYLEEEESSI